MRSLLLILTFFWAVGVFAQNLDNVGIDNHPVLNEDEVILLNSLLEELRDTFDFANKKVAFITGSNGGTIVTKSKYFRSLVIPWIVEGSSPQIGMIILSEEDKEKSGGYDVLVFSWVKIFSPRSQERAIRRLGTTK